MQSGRSSIYPTVRITLCVGGAITLSVLAWLSRDTLADVLSMARLAPFAAAVALGLALTLSQGLSFGLLMRKNGSSAPLRRTLSAFLLSQPGKYLPGKVWAPLMQKVSLGNEGSLVAIGASNIELTVVALVQMVSLGAACLSFSTPMLAAFILVAGVIVGALVLRISAIPMLASMFPSFTARLGVISSRPDKPLNFLSALGASASMAALTLTASWLVIEAMGQPHDLKQSAALLGTLFMGFGSGILVFVVPAGLGVREAATAGIGAFTMPGVPEGLLVAVALFARGWQLAVDGVSFVLGLLLSRSA